MALKTDPFVQAERHVQNALARLPPFVARFLGHRGKTLPPSPNYLVCLWGFIGAFGGLGIIFAVFAHTEYFTSRMVPPIIASFVRDSPNFKLHDTKIYRVHLLFSVTDPLTPLLPSRVLSSSVISLAR
jgi:hypothetical protein